MRVDGVSVLVTGGGSGLGRAAGRALADRGAQVTLVDRDGEAGSRQAHSLSTQAGRPVRFALADVTSQSQMEAAIEVAERSGPLRVLVHCAGRGGTLRVVDRDGRPGSLQTFADVVRVNLVGTFNVLRLSAARMAAAAPLDDDERGVCVLTASIAAFEGQVGQIAYAASKAGVVGSTLVAARDLAGRGIRVNTVAPGVFDTAMLGRLPDEVRQSLAATVPYPRRLGRAEEFASLVCHAIDNRMLNGETIRLDGALRMAAR